ncbi:TPA: methyl-accepting chemotaxis protein [bacterium]|nr:methyl-accepting chemotaxis protein [bacterium]
MLNKIKIGPKLIGGFVIVSLISVVIGVIGYVSLKEVGNVRLPSIIGLQRIFRTMNDLRVSERTLLLPDLSAEYKQLMTNRMNESWKTLEEGWKIYEPLPQTKEEAIIWKQFVPAFEDWKTKHETVIQLALAGKIDEAKTLSTGDGSQALLEVEEHLKSLITLNDKVADAYVKRANSIVLISVILGFIIAVVLGIALTLSITKPITNMVEVSNNIANGDIEQRIEHKSADEIGLLANSFRQMVDYVRGVADSVISISKGDVSIDIKPKSDKDVLSKSVVQVTTTLKDLISEANTLSKAAIAGKLDTRGNAQKFQGGYQDIVQGVNDTLDAVIGPLNVAAEYVDRISKGDIPPKITESYNGDFNEIKNNLNQCIDAINLLVSEANILSKAAVEGKLDTRADATKHQGDFRKIVEGVNDTLDAVIAPINESSKVLAECAEGDLTVRMTGDYKGQLAELKNSINTTIESLETTLSQVNSSVGQVSSASEQIASGSQSLAESASEQASSLEEISSSLEELSSMAKQNADNSSQAKNLSQEASNSAKAGNEAMDMMNQAITKIKGSSDETAKIIKTIDEIAFQTNLLALNAAVEAARAGEAGKGFAVVAEEVRNLAQRSASAAKNTSDLIQQATENADDGVRISGEVAKTFAEIAQNINKVNDLIAEISAASTEQSQGIGQINTAVADMDKLTQSNAANSEQSASAAQELSAQVSELRSMIGRFRMNGNGHSKSENSVKNVMSMISKKADTKEKKKPANTMNLSSSKGKDFFPLDDTELAEF